MRTLKLTIAYDGTRYVGWQRQAHGTSVQALVEAAIAPIEQRRVRVTGSGRTDAGVHALGQVASVELQHGIAIPDLQRALNARLPDDVRVVAVEEAGEGFNARFSARWKTYRYRLLNREVGDPFERTLAWHVPHRLDVAGMRDALGSIVGTHDFAAFQAAGSRVTTTERTVRAAALWQGPEHPSERRPDVLVIEVTANGFLRHMVRTIVGTVVEVGLGRRSAASLAEALAARDRRLAGPTAPGHGLYLVGVEYGDPGAP
jgi:tRNA pseudouridine38-40 synthase